MIRRKIAGQSRLRHQDYEAIRRDVRSLSLRTSTPGMDVRSTPGGSIVAYKDPLRTRWVYVMAVSEDGRIIAKEARRGSSGVSVSANDVDLIVGFPAPSYMPADFAGLVIAHEQPTMTDPVCLYTGGFFVPDKRTTALFCYVVGITADGMIQGRVATDHPEGYDPDGDIIEARPAPGYTPEHFEFDIIAGEVVATNDRVALLIGGRFVPDRRMKLVAPADISEFCQPCGESASASMFNAPRRFVSAGARMKRAASRLLGRRGDCPGCGKGSP